MNVTYDLFKWNEIVSSSIQTKRSPAKYQKAFLLADFDQKICREIKIEIESKHQHTTFLSTVRQLNR